MLEFLCAVYNEQDEIDDLIDHVANDVDILRFVDDGSTDSTVHKILTNPHINKISLKQIRHTGLCEVARIEGLAGAGDDSWILMCDADERFMNLGQIKSWLDSPESEKYTHVVFDQFEYVDGIQTRVFQKVKLFKKSVAHLSPIIHKDPEFDGEGAHFGLEVIHRKTSEKQKKREREYLNTYDKLQEEGVITQKDKEFFQSMHYFERR